MMTGEAEDVAPAKRRRLNDDLDDETAFSGEPIIYKGLDRPISPPLTKRKSPTPAAILTPDWGFHNVRKQNSPSAPATGAADASQQTGISPQEVENEGLKIIPSPVQLTKIEDLVSHQNVDTVELKEILGDPLIQECWNFNFLFDLEFVMQHFDSDVRDMVNVKIVHGFWKRDDERRISLLEQAERYPNIELLSAYIPDPFGTHHSKMLILFRHDDTAQVVIHTANMIERDWKNMTQAVWTSPRLPLKRPDAHPTPSPCQPDAVDYAIGSGERFKVDLLRYLGAYEKRLRGLITKLADYDFFAIKAAFIGSAPSRQKPDAARPANHTSFGWLGLQEILSRIPIRQSQVPKSAPHIVVQISSIATLGATPVWLTHFRNVLARYAPSATSNVTGASISAMDSSKFFVKRGSGSTQLAPKFNVIFPTTEEIRTSLDGYASGGSIHWKLQSAQQQKQLEYLKPMLCHWKHDSSVVIPPARRQAHRGPAAPHIKTYIRFGDDKHETIDWAMVTSANLSKQAWGDVVNKKDEIWIQSWETGVVVWPDLFIEQAETRHGDAMRTTIMVPVFGKDMLEPRDTSQGEGDTTQKEEVKGPKTVVGFRMPYDLPLSPYAGDEKPWCATLRYEEADRMGRTWSGY